MKKLKRKKSEFYNNGVLEKFELLMNRDKSNDIIDYNWLKKNKRIYDEIMYDFFNRRIKDLFSSYLDRMNDSNDEDKKLFIEGLNKKIKIRKMF
jgi:hypothetical protein